VARYLSDYFESLESQTIGIDNLEIFLVDDGSTDNSLELCQAFAEKYSDCVTVLTKDNGGQASARNTALPLASTPWICFPDPDDALSSNFFESIRAHMNKPESSETVLFAGHIIMWHELSGKRVDNHPTAFRFKIGSSTTDLVGKPNFIHGNAVMSFFSRRIIESAQLRFDDRLRSRFEDGNFVSRYLLLARTPVIGLVDDAHYYYRQRSDGTSTVQGSASDPRSYVDVPKYGYLAVLKLARDRGNGIPRWLQTLIVYDILWIFKSDVSNKRATRSQSLESLSAFHSVIGEVMKYIERPVVLGFDMMWVPYWIREALAFAYSPSTYRGQVYLGPADAARNLILVRYRYSGDQPSETIFVRGKVVQAHSQKTQYRDVLGRTLLKERRLWVSSLGVIRIDLDGEAQLLKTGEPGSSRYKFRRSEVLTAEKNYSNRAPAIFRQINVPMRKYAMDNLRRWFNGLRSKLRRSHREDVVLSMILKLVWIRRAFAGAWVLMDKDNEANDSGEQLYRWIRENRPNTKLWFVLRRTSGDWARLKRDNFRLVEFRSYRWKILMLLAAHVVSSHVDHYISNPLPSGRYGPPQWKLSFLQHGIIKGDLSNWLNTKQIDFFATSTEDEYHYIAGDSTYKFSPKQVRLTGLPRHDALLEKSRSVPASEVNQILVSPTWRQYLVGQGLETITMRERNETFMQSDFAQKWKELLDSPELRAFALDHDLKIVFLPHPNIQPYVTEFELPSYVESRSFGQDDIQDVVSRSAVMVTDYSSAAFNMAYLQRPVVYFQFDRARYEAEHTEGQGYFDYQTHGFGPVVVGAPEVVKSLEELWTDLDVKEHYVNRAKQTFPVRDGKNSERVYRAIVELSRPLSFKRGSIAAEPDSWDQIQADSGSNPSRVSAERATS